LISEPGVYDLPPEEYHRDPVEGGSLTSTGARRLISACPARYRYELENPPEPTDAMDIGSAAHRLVLGAGAELEVIDAPDWRTRSARERRDEARAAGRIPILAADYETARAMAEVVADHPIAGAALRRQGAPEQTLVWRDRPTGVWCRAMVDYLPTPQRGRRLVLVDYKTCSDASTAAIRASVARYRYHQQAAWYLTGVRELGLSEDPALIFVFQERSAPHLVHVVEIDPDDLLLGEALNRRALEIYRDCREAGVWPGHADHDITLISLPGWARRDEEDAQ